MKTILNIPNANSLPDMPSAPTMPGKGKTKMNKAKHTFLINVQWRDRKTSIYFLKSPSSEVL